MKIVLAPDSFKESLTALEAAEAMKAGFQQVFPDGDYALCPMADGGEGTVQSLVDATGGTFIYRRVTGPLMEPVDAYFGLSGDGKTAVIEMAQASGLDLVPADKRNPMLTTTKGTGELIAAALDEGVERIVVGIGGSATNDGGTGMVQALGVRLLDERGEEIAGRGAHLQRLKTIDTSGLDSRLANVRIDVACDVNNPLTGSNGAAYIYGPQKGATEEQVRELDVALGHYANVMKEQLQKDVADINGAGAAGGLGAGLLAFLDANLMRGGDLVIDTVNLAERVEGADLVITGEGGINEQTVFGKTPICVARVAKQFDIPVIAIAGSLSKGYESVYDAGIDAVFSSVSGIMSLEEAKQQAHEQVQQTAENVARIIKLTKAES
ncbi:glycerate kinase [Texcoconibacillus texcoconensis]|uniref:Glycerate kinase n=1 Tax=Texcoconibacillus texcoconensis TaxID=1095777 RepID=A0A840QSB7_9BACI|nr:glycerate kinase [Texcoconibacillus texcoconensis]MBB5174406.1 glycerate kinase [Texcoconibacillus texcoconensis]